jgi:site-specific DNA recombinase
MGIIAGYIRVSLDTEPGTSIEAQTEILEKWAAAQDREIRLYVDRGISASKDILRPQFEQLRLDVTSGLVDKIIVKSADRLSRNLRRFVEFADEAREHNTEIISVEQGIDTSTAVGVLMLQLLSTFAEFEATQIGQRQKTSIAHRRSVGRSVNMPPLGYRSVTRGGGQFLEIDPEHAPTVRALVDGLLAGSSVRAVARDLNERGLLPKSGKNWTSAPLGRLAQNPQIVGMTRVGDDVFRDSNGLPRIEEHLQIISLEEWQLLQEVMSERSTQRPHGTAGERQLLYGLACCGNCGRILVRDTTKNYSRYRCTGKTQQNNPCTAPVLVQEHVLDNYVTQQIEPLLDMPATTLNREQDPVALQRRMLLEAEVTLLSTSMGSLQPEAVPEAAVRLADLITQRDSVEIDEVVTRVESDQTLREWYANDPRHVLSMLIEQVSVKSGQVPIAERVIMVWREDEDHYYYND